MDLSDRELQLVLKGLRVLKAIGQTLSEDDHESSSPNDVDYERLEADQASLESVDEAESSYEALSESEDEAESPLYEESDDDEKPLPTRAYPPPYYNARKAARVLEDFLCIEVLKDVEKASTHHSLKTLSIHPEHKVGVQAMLNRLGWRQYHLIYLFSLKKTAPLCPQPDWYMLRRAFINEATNPCSETILQQLWQALSNFIGPQCHGFYRLKSPLDGIDEGIRFVGHFTQE